MLKLNCAAASESESATFTAGMTGKKRGTASGAMNATRPSAKAKARPGTCRRGFSTVVKRLRWGQRRGLRLACAGGQRYARLDRVHTHYTASDRPGRHLLFRHGKSCLLDQRLGGGIKRRNQPIHGLRG